MCLSMDKPFVLLSWDPGLKYNPKGQRITLFVLELYLGVRTHERSTQMVSIGIDKRVS